jgi:hypothetical protein
MAAESFLVQALSILISDRTGADLSMRWSADGPSAPSLEKISVRQDELHADWSYVDGWKTRLDLSG